MTCVQDGEQLELQLTAEKVYARFSEDLLRKIMDHGISEAVCFELRNWAEFHDFAQAASWTRRLLRELDVKYACVLLECFGIAFRGDQVGHIGRDLITRPLHSENWDFRAAAVNVLGRWLEYDEDGMWFDMAEAHLEREEDEELHSRLWNSIPDLGDDDDEKLLRWILEDEGEFEEEELPTNPLLEEFLEARRGCECELRGTFPLLRVGPILAKLTGMPDHLMAGVVEMMRPWTDMDRILKMKPGARELGIYTTSRSAAGWNQGDPLRHLRIWDTNGSFAFSLEPTATKDRVLLFCYLR